MEERLSSQLEIHNFGEGSHHKGVFVKGVTEGSANNSESLDSSNATFNVNPALTKEEVELLLPTRKRAFWVGSGPAWLFDWRDGLSTALIALVSQD